ncbi:GNAT family N-acetyltransferase [Streptomyces humi]|uniref:GNAT family N-acetyltransferase n=1 Tax=Streptomyces humi TaxID=1428620 RepID=UPI000628823C|nr:GNAT family N-acetyltransferase [Streptomyces humi]
MGWPRWGRRRAAGPLLPLPGPCWSRRHTLRTARLLLYTPETSLDLAAALAAASDAEAQRWLGWGERVLSDPHVVKTLLGLRPGDTGALRSSRTTRNLLAQPWEPGPDDEVILVAVRLDDGRYAGSTGVHPGTGEIGGWLAPDARGQGLGTELFTAAVLLAHTHLGLRTVRAGHEPANGASARALANAGFVAADGPSRHTLPDGREIEARWLEHTTTTRTARCPGTGPPAPPA